ncbi:MAG: DeoR family transcriptional regulator [bacterium]|nr:DeoR family transcriptional regulator [bacterium]
MHITERQSDILNFLIEEYIYKAEPISSGFIEEISDLGVSAATIRNDLQELTKKKFIIQLHTSGGRVPTDRGYRFYVDNLINSEDLDINYSWQKRVDAVLASISSEPRDINKTIAQLVSDLSESVVITGIAEDDDFYKTGLASLFEMPEFREINKVFRMTSFFDEFDRIFDQIEKEFFGASKAVGDPEDLNIFIGHENRHPSIKDETVMTIRYTLPNNLVGSLTIIGPTRMDYRKNIGLIRYTTDKINQLTKNI